jgi:uncharacterized protein
MTLYETITTDLKEAMKARQKKRLEVLRMMKSKIMTVNSKGDISDDEILKILNTYEKNLKDAYEQSNNNNREEAAAELKEEIDIVSAYLPKKLTEAETKTLVEEVIQQTGATSKKDMGKVMGAIMKSGKPIDGKLVKSIVDGLLT